MGLAEELWFQRGECSSDLLPDAQETGLQALPSMKAVYELININSDISVILCVDTRYRERSVVVRW